LASSRESNDSLDVYLTIEPSLKIIGQQLMDSIDDRLLIAMVREATKYKIVEQILDTTGRFCTVSIGYWY
jgi:hypothetical protein